MFNFFRFNLNSLQKALAVTGMVLSFNLSAIESNYKPTVLDSVNMVTKVYNNLRGDDNPKSQCFYRAQTWCHDMEVQRGIKSEKIFIFFSARFQRTFNEKWWFHVAPLVYTRDGSGTTGMVLDKTFNFSVTGNDDRPVTEKEWVDHFGKGVHCAYVSSYAEYEEDTQKPLNEQQMCYIIKVPMYHFAPVDIKSCHMANPPYERTSWTYQEVEDSKLAFGDNNIKHFFHRKFGIRF